VAYERGLWKDGMVLQLHDDTNTDRSVFHALNLCPDFNLFVKSILQEEIEKLNHLCDFLPKFHCELSPIERVWSKSKRYVRNFSDDTRETLLKNIRKSFWVDNVSLEQLQDTLGKRTTMLVVTEMEIQLLSRCLNNISPTVQYRLQKLCIHSLLTCL